MGPFRVIFLAVLGGIASALGIVEFILDRRHDLRKWLENRGLLKGRKETIYLNGLTRPLPREKTRILNQALRAREKYNYEEAITDFKILLGQAPDDSERCALLNLIGLSQKTKGDTHDAEQTFLEMIRIAEKADLKEALAAAYSNIGNVYFTLGESKKALEYHQRALKIDEKIGNLEGQASQLGNMGVVYEDLAQFKEGLDYFQRAREIFAKIGAKHKVKICDRNIARVKKAMGEGG